YRPNGLSRDKVDVLLRFDPASATGSGLPAAGGFPLVWTKTYGQGRVVYSSLSHSTEAWDIRNVQIMMFEAIKWSLGLSEAPVQPHSKRDPGPREKSARRLGPTAHRCDQPSHRECAIFFTINIFAMGSLLAAVAG